MMKELRYAVISSFMGQMKDRFHIYGEPATTAQKLERISRVTGATGVEIVFPYEMESIEETKRLLDRYGLKVSSVNLNVKAEPDWVSGSFTARDPKARRKAVDFLRRAMDVAAELGSYLVTTAPLNDGYDYPFESDYLDAWKWLAESIHEGASHRSDVRVSVEYKQSEPRSHVILDSAAKSLALCNQVGLDNVGVTLDMGHALYAGESTAQSAALLAQAGKLFLVHVNDNYRNWDWDLVPGTVNFWDMVEFFYYLHRVDYDGWLVADVFPARVDKVKAFSATYRMLKLANDLVLRVGVDRITRILAEGDPLDALAEFLEPIERAVR